MEIELQNFDNAIKWAVKQGFIHNDGNAGMEGVWYREDDGKHLTNAQIFKGFAKTKKYITTPPSNPVAGE